MIAIQKNVIDLVSWIANVPVNHMLPSTHLREDLAIDSIDFMLLIVRLENYFNISLSTEEIENIETIKDAADLVERHS